MADRPKVNLRPFTRNDLPAMIRWNNDAEVERFVDCDLPKTLAECEQWFAEYRLSRDYRLYAIESGGGRLIGDLELDHISWQCGEAELRIRIGEKDCWNQGFGTEAVRAMLAIGFRRLHLRRIYLRVYRFNRRAIRCYEKCGFRKRGILHRREGQATPWKDIILMTIARQGEEMPGRQDEAQEA